MSDQPLAIHSASGAYEVRIAQNAFAEATDNGANAILLADEFFRDRLADRGTKTIFLEAREQSKSLDQAPALIEHMRTLGATRSTLLVAIGGGIVQDIAAFIASVYMRGVAWTYVPTTVLAMVDSCIGGKSSINVGPYKNLVGTFHPPQSIAIDPALASSLPSSDFASGLVEAAKITFCRGPESFARYLDFAPAPHMATDRLQGVIYESLSAKKYFIEIDEFDRKERLLLNFGHTFGHAIEGASHYQVPHGIAVGLGILCAIQFQRARGIACNSATITQLDAHLRMLTSTLPNLSGLLSTLSMQEIMDRFASDKKHSQDQYTVIVPDENAAVTLLRLDRTRVVQQHLQQAIQETLESYP